MFIKTTTQSSSSPSFVIIINTGIIYITQFTFICHLVYMCIYEPLSLLRITFTRDVCVGMCVYLPKYLKHARTHYFCFYYLFMPSHVYNVVIVYEIKYFFLFFISFISYLHTECRVQYSVTHHICCVVFVIIAQCCLHILRGILFKCNF